MLRRLETNYVLAFSCNHPDCFCGTTFSRLGSYYCICVYLIHSAMASNTTQKHEPPINLFYTQRFARFAIILRETNVDTVDGAAWALLREPLIALAPCCLWAGNDGWKVICTDYSIQISILGFGVWIEFSLMNKKVRQGGCPVHQHSASAAQHEKRHRVRR